MSAQVISSPNTLLPILAGNRSLPPVSNLAQTCTSGSHTNKRQRPVTLHSLIFADYGPLGGMPQYVCFFQGKGVGRTVGKQFAVSVRSTSQFYLRITFNLDFSLHLKCERSDLS